MTSRLTEAQVEELLERLKDPEQARAFLHEAGLIDDSGDLAEPEPEANMLRVGDVWDIIVADPKSRKKDAAIKKRFEVKSWCEAELACHCVAEDGQVVFISRLDPINDYYEPGLFERISWGGQYWPWETQATE